MGLPKVIIEQQNGNLGRAGANEAGIAALVVSGIAVATKLALNQVIVLGGIADLKAYGLDAAYDATNSVLVYRHVKDFYDEAGEGAELHLMVVAQTSTLTDMVDSALVLGAKLLKDAGNINFLAVARNPAAEYVPVITEGLDTDVVNAIAKAKALRAYEEGQYRYPHILIEGRAFAGNIATVKDLRAEDGPLANRVSVVLNADPAVSAVRPGYAAIGLALGRLAKLSVQRSMARVKDGPVNVAAAGLSDGSAISTFTEIQLGDLHDKGYIFLRKHVGKDGFYFNGEPTAAPISDDYSRISRGRIMDKASRLVRAVYLEELEDDVEVDPTTGKLLAGVIKSYQAAAENSIEVNMLSRGEISGVSVTVDPDQDVLSTDEIKTEVVLVPKAISSTIKAILKFENPLNS
jgi:hypothetical protein